MPLYRAWLAFVAAALSASVYAQHVPLEVHNPTSVALSAYPVTFGVPSPKFEGHVIPSLESLRWVVKDASGVAVPHQYRVLSRWDGLRDDLTKSIKWVEVSFLADCPPHSTANYRLEHGTAPQGQITVASNPDHLVITTAPGTVFMLNRHSLSVFEEVFVDGQQIVASPGGGIRMRAASGGFITPVVWFTNVEQPGKTRTVVVQKGRLGPLNYTMRYMFHSGRKDVTVDFRLENPGKYGGFFAIAPEHAYFDFLHLFLPLAGGGDLVNSGGSTASLNGQVYDLSQTFAWGEPLRPLDGFSYQERSGGTVLSTGNRHIGAIDLSGPVGGVTIAVDRFWENFPKAFRANAGEIEVGLWPEWGNGPEYRGTYANFTSPDPIDPMAVSNYRFEGGRWKTHRMTFDFHVGGRNGAGVARVAELTNRPPMGRAPSSWLTRTEALGPFVVGAKDWSDTGRDRYERFFDILVDDNSADLQGSGLGRLGFRGFRNRGGTYGGRQFFGWENYGDIMWGEGASSLHYDWSYGVMLGWARSGNYEHYDVARDMAWHRRDYDQNHSTTESWRGCQYYEKGWWHGNFTPGKSSHNWVGGVLLHYAMTGDEASYEAAMEAQAFLLRDCPSNWTGYWGTRIAAWGTTNLLDLYNYLGHSAALNEARLALENFQDLEQASGGGGYVLNPGGGYVTIIWMEALMFSAGAKYTVLSKDTQYLPLLHRMKTWFRANLHVGAIANDMPLPSVTQIYHQNHTQELLSVHHMWYLANAFAQSAMLWNEPADMDLAFLTFEFCVRYHQGTPGMNTRFDDSATYSPMAMRMTHYPNSESKIIGGVLSEGQSYMALRSWLEGSRYTTE